MSELVPPLPGELVGMILRFRSDGSDDSESLGVIDGSERLPSLVATSLAFARHC